MDKETKQWLSNKFSIPENDILHYNSGVCYSRIGVATEQSANKIRDKMEGRFVNGGMFDGMPLGGVTKYDGYFEVIC